MRHVYEGGAECEINRADKLSDRQKSPLVHHPRAHSPYRPHFGITADMKVNPNCDHGDILLNPGNKNQAQAGRTLPISGHV